jgi:hypothetical protein
MEFVVVPAIVEIGFEATADFETAVRRDSHIA